VPEFYFRSPRRRVNEPRVPSRSCRQL
jgi:hypothetical protein